MANENGFRFKIDGEVFIRQDSKAGEDVVAAYNQARDAREKIEAALADVPATFTIGQPIAATRRAAEAKPGNIPEPGK